MLDGSNFGCSHLHFTWPYDIFSFQLKESNGGHLLESMKQRGKEQREWIYRNQEMSTEFRRAARSVPGA